MRKINNICGWLDHFFWLIGVAVCGLLQFRRDYFTESVTFLVIHLTYRGGMLKSSRKIPLKRRIRTSIEIIIGVVTCFLIVGVPVWFLIKLIR